MSAYTSGTMNRTATSKVNSIAAWVRVSLGGKRRSKRLNSGQMAMAMMTAQASAARKPCRIHRANRTMTALSSQPELILKFEVIGYSSSEPVRQAPSAGSRAVSTAHDSIASTITKDANDDRSLLLDHAQRSQD